MEKKSIQIFSGRKDFKTSDVSNEGKWECIDNKHSFQTVYKKIEPI